VSTTGLAEPLKSIPIFGVLADQKGSGILLANLHQSSRSTFSWESFPSFFGLDHGIGHFMLCEVDSEARAPAPPMLKWPQTSNVAADRKSAPQPLFRQAA
jgi:hypothetical protein